jgi:ribonuclease HII
VVAFCCRDDDLQSLAELGVRDSKLLTPKRRLQIYAAMLERPDRYWFHSIHITSNEIDTRKRAHETLNEIERWAMLSLVEQMVVGPRKQQQQQHPVQVDKYPLVTTLQIDSVEGLASRWSVPFVRLLTGTDVRVVCENGADGVYVCVAAASVIAKV